MTTTPSKNQVNCKSIVLVISLLVLTLVSIFLSRRSLHELQQASTSVYMDRLVPSVILVNLTSTIYQKRLVLETSKLTVNRPEAHPVGSTMDQLDRRVDSLLTEFGRTRLTTQEAHQFHLLKQRLLFYNGLASQLNIDRQEVMGSTGTLFAGSSNAAFRQVVQTLEALSTLQLSVGEDLLIGSREQTLYSYVLTALQIGLLLLIGLSLFWYRF